MRAFRGSWLLWLSGAALAQAPPPAGFPGNAPPSPPAIIREFTVAPTSIQPGGGATLRWEVLNAYSLSIEPAIGAVGTRGSQRVSPAATTTYVLEATGAGGVARRAVTVTVVGRAPASSPGAQLPSEAPAPTVALLSDGTPDLSGLFIAERDVRLQGAVALKPGGEAFRVPPQEGDLGTGVTCLPPGVPQATMMPFPFQIVHRPDVLVILYEAYHQFRIIPIGREHADYLAPAYMGHSVARWEDDTLVVEVRGFNDKTLIAGHRHTEELRVIEHYRRTTQDTIAYEAYVSDPNVFAEPLHYSGTLRLHPEWEIGEYVCSENDQDYEELFDAD